MVFPSWFGSALKSATEQLAKFAVNLGNQLAQAILSVGGGVLTGFFDIFIAIVIAFWALKDLPKIREELVLVVGPTHEDDAETLIKTVVHVVGGYLKGVTIASLVTGFLATVGLAIIGVPYALVLGMLTFVFNYIPYVGPFIAGAIAALVGLFVSPLTALLAIAVVVLAQQLTDNLVTPRVMSETVDLHPTLVIFSLLVGGTLFGIPGMLFAIPVAGTAKGLFVYYYERRTKRSLETEDGALFRTGESDSDEDVDDDGVADRVQVSDDSGTDDEKKPRRSDT
jgi:predicted PurR-regulated permease PerM